METDTHAIKNNGGFYLLKMYRYIQIKILSFGKFRVLNIETNYCSSKQRRNDADILKK